MSAEPTIPLDVEPMDAPTEYKSEYDIFLEQLDDRITDLQSTIEDATQRLAEVQKLKTTVLTSVTLADVTGVASA